MHSLDMRHSQREIVFDGVHGALQPAGPAVPTFDGIKNDGFFLLIWPVKNIARTNLIAIATFDTVFIDEGRHPVSPTYLENNSMFSLSPGDGVMINEKLLPLQGGTGGQVTKL